MNLKKYFSIIIITLLAVSVFGQVPKKYAVMIGGDPHGTNIPQSEQWNQAQYMEPKGFDEFWNDTYLMWEMLYDKDDYSNDNIFVLFNNGTDYTFPNMDGRYKSFTHHSDITSITDYSATKANIQQVFSSLATTVTPDDFVYVWIMSHGGNTNPQGNGHSYVYLSGYTPSNPDAGRLYDYELVTMLQNINANKIVVNIQAPYSGGFATQWQGNDNTIIFTSSDKDESSSRADDHQKINNAPVIENETINGITYHHGEYGFHYYSVLNGADPTGNTNYGTSFTFADGNNNLDHVISLYEAYLWEYDHNSSGETIKISGNGIYTSDYVTLKYPSIITYNISTNQYYRGIIGITAPPPEEYYYWRRVEINNNSTVSFHDNSIVYLFPDIKLVNVDGILNIGDNVVVKGDTTTTWIFSQSDLNIGNNVIFTGNDDVQDPDNNGWFGGLATAGISLNMNHVLFNKAIINTMQNNDINLTNSTFRKSLVYINYNYGNLYVDSCHFDKSSIYAGAINYPSLQVANSTFKGPLTLYTNTGYLGNKAINFAGYGNYIIKNDSISNYQDGIYMCYSGNVLISNGISIMNNVICNNSGYGITAEHSKAFVTNNNIIKNNNYGIVTGNYTNMRIWGNKNALSTDETQQVYDNYINQIWSSSEEFPYLKWNAIWDNDNTDCLAKWVLNNFDKPTDVRYNYWGGSYFDPDEDLCPTANFIWNPVWNLNSNIQTFITAEQLYQDALFNIDQSNYSNAKTECKQIILNYPQTSFASYALLDLLDIEQNADNNYSSLKTYFLTNSTILNDSSLTKIANWLSNWCDIYQGNYQIALDYLDSVVTSPPSYYDSVNALLDINYINQILENSNIRSSNNYITYNKPIVGLFNGFSQKSNPYLELLVDKSNVTKFLHTKITTLKYGTLLNNYPNPFSSTTKLWYKLKERSNVNILLYNSSGLLIRTIKDGNKTAGNHSIEIRATGLSSGLYYCTLQINNQIVDTKKISFIK